MNQCFLALICLHLLLTFVLAQDGDEPLIPNREEKPNYIGVKDPFAPSIANTPTSATQSNERLIPANQISSPNPSESQDNLGGLNEGSQPAPAVKTDSNWEDELLNGSDDDFKPAPLKVAGDEEPTLNQTSSPTPTAEASPEPTTSTETIITPQNDLDIGETNFDATATPTPTPTIVIKRELPQEQIKPSELITEEIDPWDDPRKKISTTCRLQLERIKKKKKLLERAEATQLKLQESLASGKGEIEKIKQVSSKLSNKILDLKKELTLLKERGVRQGCPGIYF